MSQVEPERVAAKFGRQTRLPVLPIAKAQPTWLNVQVLAENCPEHATRDDEPPPVSLKAKTLRPRHLVVGERLHQSIHAFGWLFK